MNTFILKLVLTPLLIAALTLIGRRWGPAVGGALAGLPLTSGPVSLFLALEQGRIFAADAAVGTLTGLIAVAAFAFAYSVAAGKTNWFGSTIVSVAAFFAAAALLLFGPIIPLSATFAIVIGILTLTFLNMPGNGITPEAPVFPHPRWDLPLRMGIATALVLLLTALAEPLGPQLTGLISPFPVFALVLAAFAHQRFGLNDARRVLRGVVLGSFAFALFFLVIGGLLPRHGWSVTYSVASVSALSLNALLFARLRRRL